MNIIESPCKNCQSKSCVRTCTIWTDWFRATWTAVTALFKDNKETMERPYDGHRKNYYSRNNRKPR